MSETEQEKHADALDRASQLEMENTAGLVSEIRKRSKRTQEPNGAGVYLITECIECDNDIGQGRLMHSIKNTLCIHCATAQEANR